VLFDSVVVRVYSCELGYGHFCDRCIELESDSLDIELISDSSESVCSTCGRGASAS